MAYGLLLTPQFSARGIRLGRIETSAPETPLSFGDVQAEQRAPRCTVGLFDFSFMGCFDVSGRDARAYIDRLQTRDLARLAPERLAYTLLLREDGTVLIDATVWHMGSERFRVVSGRRSDIEHLRAVAKGYEVDVDDASERTSVIAVQGPRSADLLSRCGATDLPSYFRFATMRLLKRACTIARVGYTGELGYEVFVEPAQAAELWNDLLAVGDALGVRECGLEAADALRIESGFILFSRELVLPLTPYEIGCGHLVETRKAFLGASALNRRQARRPTRVLVGLAPLERSFSPPWNVHAVSPSPPLRGSGVLTSMAYSALFERRIGLGFVHPCDRYPGTRVRLKDGLSGTVARLPFYDPVKKRARSLPS